MKHNQKELKKKLTSMQYHVTQENGTEPAFDNAYYNNKRPGLYVDVVTRKPLFTTQQQFDSGCGWPSFTKPVGDVKENFDTSYGMRRTEVRTKDDTAHLGHVFNDGPSSEGGLRYCINSAALDFIPVEDLKKEGYEAYLKYFKTKE